MLPKAIEHFEHMDHITNEEVSRKMENMMNSSLWSKKWKLRFFGHVSRSYSLAKTILQDIVKGKRRRGRQKKRWEDIINGLCSTRAAENRIRLKGVVAKSSVVPQQPCKDMR